MALDMRRYENVLRKQTGRAIRPARFDGYVNLINRYGTAKDDTEQYFFKPEPIVDDTTLEMFYENNGLFARIIDTPAEEAVKHGFTLEDISDDEITKFYEAAIDELDWEETAMTALKWARLFGGSLAVMLINDGHGLEEPVDWKHIRSIDDIVVFDRSMIMPDRTSLYQYDPEDPFRTRGSRLGTPEWYEITGPNGTFVVHDSRCLTFRNGVLPLNAQNENYQIWGIPEYVRISRAVRNAEVAHESAPKMLSKSVQPVYKMKDLAMELATEDGEDKVLRRLQAIDMARGLLNSITIDAEGEDYSFQSFGFNGVSDVIESSCNWLSALTNIPQTILFGRSPAGMNATGHSDFENYYNYVERIQKRMLRSNLRYLLSIIFTAGKHTGEIKEIPDLNIQFNPLWSMNEEEETQLETAKLQNEMTRASIAQAYIEMQALDPKEVRVELGKDDPMDPETMLNDMSEEELLESAPQGEQGEQGGEGGMGGMMGGGMPQMPQSGELATQGANPAPADYAEQGNSPETAPEATKLPQDMNPEDEPDHEDAEGETTDPDDLDWITLKNGVHVPLDPNGKALGGPVEGADFSEAKSEEKSESAEEKSGESLSVESTGSSANTSKREAVQGKDISASYDGPKDIKSVIHAQGFDGLPRLVSQEDFDKAVKASNFLAQRAYSASSQEILDEYQNQLYNGEWYVECTVGGAQYGQGMYCAADYTGTLSDGIKSEMEHYTSMYKEQYRGEAWFAELANKDWQSEQKKKDEESIEKYGEPTFATRQYGAPTKEEWDVWAYMKSEGIRGYSLPEDKKKIWEQSLENHHSEAITELFVEGLNEFNDTYKGNSKVETFTLDPDAKIVSYDDIRSIQYGSGTEKETAYKRAFMLPLLQEKADKLGLNDTEIGFLKSRLDLFEDDQEEEKARSQWKALDISQRNEFGNKIKDTVLGPIREAYEDHINAAREMDTGAFAALLGYDAINAGGHGQSGSYTVILNRSKCIFLADDKRTDAEDKNMITFRLGKDGKIDAIRDGKVIGWVLTQENSEAGHEDEEDDSLEPGGVIKSWSAPDYQPPVFDPDESGWLVKDINAIMSFIPDDDTNSPEWLDDEIKRRIRSVGVIVVDKNGKILSGIRKGGTGENYGLLGGPGGHVEPHESLEDAAIRETYEEFGIVAKDLTFLTLGDYEDESGMIPAIFLCTDWAGTVHPIDGEMENLRFRTIDDILSYTLFEPFKTSLEILENELTFEPEDGNITTVEADERFDEDNGQVAKLLIAVAVSKGYVTKDDGNDPHNAAEYLKERGISPDSVVEGWQDKSEAGEQQSGSGKTGESSGSAGRRNKKQETANKKKAEKERKKQEEYEKQVAREYGATGLSHFKRNANTITVDAEIKIYKHPDKTRSVYTLLKGEVKVTDVFCGKGDPSGRTFKDAAYIAKCYGGDPDDWGHAKGPALIRDEDGSVSVRVVHWMEHPSLGQHDWKIKDSD